MRIRGIAVAPRLCVLATLVVLNLAAQLFDGIATYIGVERFGELNPLLRLGFAQWGVETTLVVAKLTCIVLILAMAGVPRRRLATAGLSVTLSAYVLFSFVPWTWRLLLVAP